MIWNDFFAAMQKCDFASIAGLFDLDATYDDSNPNGSYHLPAHLIGQEAIFMYFANRLIFHTIAFVSAQTLTEDRAEVTWSIDGKETPIVMEIKARSADGKVAAMVVTPAA